MPKFGRDTNIGYSTADASIVTVLERLEVLVTVAAIPENLALLIKAVEEELEELKHIKKTNELILGQEVEEV